MKDRGKTDKEKKLKRKKERMEGKSDDRQKEN